MSLSSEAQDTNRMATFIITEGPPGQGKSLDQAATAAWLARRNRKWHEKGNPLREIWSNQKFSEKFEKEYPEYIHYWTDPATLCKLRNVDILWDEIATELDSRNFANLSSEMKRFLSQYRKRGVDIYANTQDFSMIDMRARLMISGVYTLRKLAGSRDISTTKPNPRFIWGLVMRREVLNFRETDPEKKKYAMIPSFFFIEKRLVSMYDTTQDIPAGKPAPLKHQVLYCEHYDSHDPAHQCGFKQVRHT